MNGVRKILIPGNNSRYTVSGLLRFNILLVLCTSKMPKRVPKYLFQMCIGQVIKTNSFWQASKVRVVDLKMDNYLKMVNTFIIAHQ